MLLRRASISLCLIAACFSLSVAQMTKDGAESYISTFNSAPREYGKAETLWSLRASDADLIAALKNPTTKRAAAAAVETGRRKRPAVTSALENALPKTNKSVGLLAVRILDKHQSPSSRAAIEKAVKHSDPEVRLMAAERSAMWGFKGAREVLVQAINDNKPVSLIALSKVGNKDDAALIKRYHERTPKTPIVDKYQEEAALLSRAALRDKEAIAKLRKEIDNPSQQCFRADAVRTLGRLKIKEDVPRFLTCLNDSYLGVRAAAVEALGKHRVKSAVLALKKFAVSPTRDPNAIRNEARVKQYASYVVSCLNKGKEPDPLEKFHISTSPFYYEKLEATNKWRLSELHHPSHVSGAPVDPGNGRTRFGWVRFSNIPQMFGGEEWTRITASWVDASKMSLP